jgi:hypothetical protein
MERIIFKFNSGLGAIICSGCRTIIKTGQDFTAAELASMKGETELLPAQYCSKCLGLPILKGRLHKTVELGWTVSYDEDQVDLPLHPDDAYELFELEQRFDNLEARIADKPIVEFQIVEKQRSSGIVKYAKLTNEKG